VLGREIAAEERVGGHVRLTSERGQRYDTGAMQEGATSPHQHEPLDVRLALWFAAQVILDAPARLIEAGAGAEARTPC